ncbi:MAG: hypothetical protein LBR64_06310, partial [Dysgonamonadaceae bacterium]|nr:hypothetical protein [Dysgonamonadaceae bacterium]
MKKTTVKTISGAFIFACALMLSPVLRAQVPGTPYIVPSPPSNATPAAITIDCSSYWLYYNGVALKENVAASGQEIYIT